jgi:RNA polymerase sigma factor (TIGR02999 family)
MPRKPLATQSPPEFPCKPVRRLYLQGLRRRGWRAAGAERRLAEIFSLRYHAVVSDITLLLQAASRGQSQAAEELLPLVYDELRRLASIRMAREAPGQTLQPTALVHEAWVRLVADGARTWENRAHFFAAAAEAMRRILIERARRRARLRHGGGLERLNLRDVDIAAGQPDDKIILMDEALERLKAQDPETARVVVLKFFGGLTNEEIVKVLGTSDRTVRRQWNYAKAWLYNSVKKNL